MAVLNDIFAAAFDELRRNHGIKTQKELARRMGVSEDTITRILKGRTDVTEDIITKLQTASGCIFNLQWLRGKDPFHMLARDIVEDHTVDLGTASTRMSVPELNIIDLCSHLISDLENMRRQTQQELTLLQEARHDYIQAIRELKNITEKITLQYPTTLAAEDSQEIYNKQ